MSNRMSSELQAIMQRRLAKSQSFPADEKLQDEIITSVSSGQSQNSQGQNQNVNQPSDHISITSDDDDDGNDRYQIDDQEEEPSKTKEALSSAINEAKMLLSTSTSRSRSPAMNTTGTTINQSQSQRSHMHMSMSMYNSSKSSSGSFGYNNQNRNTNNTNSVSNIKREESPFDEQSKDSPKQYSFQKKLLKRTNNTNPGSSSSTNNTSNSNANGNVSRTSTSPIPSLNITGTGSSKSGIQSHPYLKRYSPIIPTKQDNNDDDSDDDDENNDDDNAVESKSFPIEKRENRFKSLDKSNFKSLSGSMSTNIGGATSKSSGIGTRTSFEKKVSTTQSIENRFSPTFLQNQMKFQVMDKNKQDHDLKKFNGEKELVVDTTSSAVAASATSAAATTSAPEPPPPPPPQPVTSGTFDQKFSSPAKRSTQNQHQPQIPTTIPIASTSSPLSGLTAGLSSGLSSGLSLSHVTAMKKLFNKTKPPPPPPDTTPPNNSKGMNTMKSPKSKLKFFMKEGQMSLSSNNNKGVKSAPSIVSSLSSLSKEGIEITIDNFNSTITNDDVISVPTPPSQVPAPVVDNEVEVQIETGFFNDDTSTAATNDSNKAGNTESNSNMKDGTSPISFPSTSFFNNNEVPSEEQEEDEHEDEKEVRKQGKENSQNPEFVSMPAFDSLQDWSDIPTTETTPTAAIVSGTNDKTSAAVADMSQSNLTTMAMFESFNDWSDAPKSTTNQEKTSTKAFDFDKNTGNSSTFDQTFASTTKNNWDWTSDSKTNEAKEQDDPLTTTSFVKFDKFNPLMEEEIDEVLIIEDEFEDEPEINPDCLHDDVIFKSFPIIKSSRTQRGTVKNPLTDNLVVCHQRNGNHWFIDEIDPLTSALVASTPISTSDIRQKILSTTISSDSATNLKKQIICGIDDVLNITIGLHRQQNRTRVRVAAIINLNILGGNGDSKSGHSSLCIVAIWQWGYASSGRTIMLQNVISSPPKDCFEPRSLSIADGLVFIAGTNKGSSSSQSKQPSFPVIYIAKPHVRDFWSVNTLEDNTKDTKPSKVVSIAVTPYAHRRFKLLALALDDGTVSIWSYEKAAATNRRISSDKIQKAGNNQQLQMFCQLEGSSCLEMIEPTILTPCGADNGGNRSNEKNVSCCDISWISSCCSTSASILIATVFPYGVATYLVPTERPELTMVKPIAVAKANSIHQSCRVTWIEIPRYPPCLSILFSNSEKSHIIYSTLGIPSYGCPDKFDAPHELITICEDELSTGNVMPWTDIHVVETMKTIITCENRDITAIIPSSRISTYENAHVIHQSISSLVRPIASAALGVTSMGFANTKSSSDYVIYLHSQLYWKSFDQNDDSEIMKKKHFNPFLRQWLCLTRVGDRKDSRNKLQQTSNESFPTGGAQTQLLCELKHNSDSSSPLLIPQRIQKNSSGNFCAVLFGPKYLSEGNRKNIQIDCDPTSFSIFHWKTGIDDLTDIINLQDGRDVLFTHVGTERSFVVLDKDGIYLEEWALEDTMNTVVTPKCKLRIFREGSVYNKKVDSHRVFLLSSNRFLFLVSRKVDSRYFLLLGGEVKSFSSNDNCVIEGKKSKLWLKEGERLTSFIELPPTDSSKINVAISTSFRILIVCCDSLLSLIAEYAHNATCSSIAPLGSHCVSFLSYPTKKKSTIRYLSCLSGDNSVGTIATLPTSHVHQQNLVLALRPDRIVCQSILTESDQHFKCLIRVPSTRPIFLLEPLVANAISKNLSLNSKTDDISRSEINSLLERFGLKLDTTPHNENEGIGTKGVGFTPPLYQMLQNYGYSELVSRHLNSSKTLTPWIPITAKIDPHAGGKDLFHTISAGDEYLSTYLQNIDVNTSCVLPKPLDPASHILSKYSQVALRQSKLGNALTAMDLIGGSSAHSDLAAIILSLKLSESRSTVESVLSELGSDDFNSTSTLSFAHCIQKEAKKLEGEQKEKGAMKNTQVMPQFTPSYQSGICQTRRAGSHLIPHSLIHSINNDADNHIPPMKFDERKHVWNRGPFEDKEEILLLDSIEEWTGRCRPSILGKEGAEIAAESGQGTLQNLLAAAAEIGNSTEIENDNDNSQCSSMGEWVEKVGEGRNDEDNLTLYLRFFEGADEDSRWRDEGISDLSSYQNKPKLIQPEIFDIEDTSSDVEEGKSGSVRLLHDLVFNRDAADKEAAGLFLEVKRGSSLDTGMFHTLSNQSRQRATVEFWFYLPKSSEEIVLVRRSMCLQNGEDIESLCCVTEKESLIWELVALPTGRLEFRCCGGDSINSESNLDIQKDNQQKMTTDDDSEDEHVDPGLVSWPREDGYGGWNHVSLGFCCRDLEMNKCKVTMTMKGVEIVSSIVNLQLPAPGLEQGASDDIDDALSISALMFGLGATAGFRITEVRVWACARALSDIKTMMDWYLDAATIKKKIKLRIRGKAKSGGESGILMPPRGINKPKQLVAPPPENDKNRTRKIAILDEPKSESSFFENNESFANFSSPFTDKPIGFERESNDEQVVVPADLITKNAIESTIDFTKKDTPEDEEDVPNNDSAVSVEESCLLSIEVKKSAASALVRGGPATRHFGGNRGGLRDVSMNIGSIAICGAQKTVIFSCGQSPPGKTYPIGASGAIISDLMDIGETDNSQNEFLCCFLAKDKRMVVFELKSKKIVVELQMTTKLNFWRYLPPIAHGENLVFLLITPVGGFHWLPLTESPRPRQVWKRGIELQGKKIVSYEEGGSNGLDGDEHLSTAALVLTCTSAASDPVEAWCIPVHTQSKPLCISLNILGAALFCTDSMLISSKAFSPLLVTAIKENTGVAIELFSLSNDPLTKESICTREILDLSSSDIIYDAPTMAMGSSPPILCLCWKKYVVIIIRDRGLLVYYQFFEQKNKISLVSKYEFNRYVIDAGIKSSEIDDGIQISALVCETDKKDGRIVTVRLK